MIRRCQERLPWLETYDGVVAGLQQLTDVGRKLGVVTSLSESIARPALEHLGLDRFFRASAFAARKPNPAQLLAALADLGEEPDRRHYYVGDSSTDAECAARAGVAFAWASYGYGKVETNDTTDLLEGFSDVVEL